MDVSVGLIGAIHMCCLYSNMIFIPPIDSKYCLSISDCAGSRQEEFGRIYTFRHKKRALYNIYCCLNALNLTYVYYVVWRKSEFRFDLRQIIYWTLVYPPYLYYYAFGVIVLHLYNIIVVQ